MILLQDAAAVLRQNAPIVAAYVVVAVLLAIGANALSVALFGSIAPESPPDWYSWFNLAQEGGLSAAFAALQAVVFARLGKFIDRPLWKCKDDREAVRRFFFPWFVLNLLGVLCGQFMASAGRDGSSDAQALALLFEFVVFVFAVPLGACVMYHGHLQWDALGRVFEPIFSEFQHAAVAFIVLIAGYALHIATLLTLLQLLGEEQIKTAVALPSILLIAPSAFIDCLAFAIMWRVCMIHRDNSFYEDPYDF